MDLSKFVLHDQELFFIVRSKNASAQDSASSEMSINSRVKRRLSQIHNTIEDLEVQTEAIRAEIPTLNKRFQIKLRRELERQVSELEQEIEDVRSGNKARRFLKTAEPYLVAQAQNQRSFGGQGNIVDMYAVALENGPVKGCSENNDLCTTCRVPMKLHAVLAVLVCQKCGETREYLEATSSMLSYDSDHFDFSSFSYRRIGHLHEWLTSIQGKESMEIPAEVLEEVMERLKAERVSNINEITVHRIREILKKLKLRRYYDHSQIILTNITGQTPPKITQEQIEKITVMFLAASSAFERHRPPNRSNFLSYAYVLAKLCECLGYDELLPHFSYLKSRDKLANQDSTWSAICQDLDWPFRASLS